MTDGNMSPSLGVPASGEAPRKEDSWNGLVEQDPRRKTCPQRRS
jgi:hypothetical protein